jgi:hypothetical protein
VSCRIADLSVGGAALDLLDPAERISGRIEVDVRPTPSGNPGFVLQGEVRNVRSGPRGTQRVGVEFVEMTDVAMHVLTDLLDLESL